MADTGIFATTLQIQEKAGAGASTVSKAEAYTNSYIAQAENYINCICRYDFSTNYSSLSTHVKGLLRRAASSLAAMDVINYDMGGFNSLEEATTMLDFLNDQAAGCIDLLKNTKTITFTGNS